MADNPSTLFLHSLAFYRELDNQAETNEDGVRVFEGHTTKLMNQLGISSSWYSRIMRILEEGDSIVMLQRGTAHQPSVIVLRGEPDEEKINESDLTAPRHLATLVERLEKRVAALEGWRESHGGLNITSAMLNHESRISQLEQERESSIQTEV